MPQYKFDWTIKISGTIEIEAETGDEASDLFFSLSNHDLIRRSEIMPDKNKHELRFVTTEFVDVHTGDEWEDCWKHIC